MEKYSICYHQEAVGQASRYWPARKGQQQPWNLANEGGGETRGKERFYLACRRPTRPGHIRRIYLEVAVKLLLRWVQSSLQVNTQTGSLPTGLGKGVIPSAHKERRIAETKFSFPWNYTRPHPNAPEYEHFRSICSTTVRQTGSSSTTRTRRPCGNRLLHTGLVGAP